MQGLRTTYPYIVIDTPPVAAVADALSFATLVDGVVVVAGAEMVPRRAVRTTIERIAATGTRVLGVVLNRAQIDRHTYYYRHAYVHYYGSYQPQTSTSGHTTGPS